MKLFYLFDLYRTKKFSRPQMEYKMIKWFIDNLKPPYYEKIISAQVTRFPRLIPIGERIDEGIKTKKIVDPTILYSLMEQQLKRSDAKVEEGDVHMVVEDREYNCLSRYSSKRPKEIHISWGI